MRPSYRQKGMVLIFALWVLGVLTLLAVSVAAGIRQKIFLVSRMDEISRMNYLLEAAVKKAAGYIHQEMEISSGTWTLAAKMALTNNTDELSAIHLGNDGAGVGYLLPGNRALRWGVVDEESKINLNKTNAQTLTNLLMNVLSLNDEEAARLANALLDWRQYGESELTGFYSDEYYSNLQFPYPKKSADYETLDEMLLVKGVTKKIYDKLLDFVTIYGEGSVNINTASGQVLQALGLPEALVDKILGVRRGRDAIDGTPDDHIFLKTFEIAADINKATPLTLDEARAIDAVNARGLFCTNSYYFTIEAAGKLSSRSTVRSLRAVYSAQNDKIIYWKEG